MIKKLEKIASKVDCQESEFKTHFFLLAKMDEVVEKINEIIDEINSIDSVPAQIKDGVVEISGEENLFLDCVTFNSKKDKKAPKKRKKNEI